MRDSSFSYMLGAEEADLGTRTKIEYVRSCVKVIHMCVCKFANVCLWLKSVKFRYALCNNKQAMLSQAVS